MANPMAGLDRITNNGEQLLSIFIDGFLSITTGSYMVYPPSNSMRSGLVVGVVETRKDYFPV